MAAVDEEFKKSMGGFINAGCADDVKRGISTVCSEEFPSPSSVFPLSIFLGKLLDEEVKRIRNGEASKIQEALGDVLKHCLVEINKHSNKSAFDECDYTYREISFRYHDLFAGERKIGADILSRTNINSSVLHFSTDKKADILIRCAEGFLIDDESGNAETMLRKAGEFMSILENSNLSSPSITEIKRRYNLTQARVDDGNRKFLEAAKMYHALSNNSSIVQRERLEYLGKAITCAVLGKGKAGPQGSRVLGLLHKDERLKELEALQVQGKGTTFASHASILTKLYMERLLLDQNELDTFENSLVDHQRAIISDGRTYLQKAVIEHNMQAASKIYENIAFPELGSILRLGTKEAEAVAAKMISDKHLHASIDQTENMLIFGGAMPDGADTAGLISWDDRIHDICKEASDAVDVLVLKYPALHEITDV